MVYLYLALFPLMLISCQENPYPENGDITEIKPLEGVRQMAYVIDPEMREMTFTEGRRSEYGLNFYVPVGEPVISFPEEFDELGASFDEATNTLSWEPDFSAANSHDPLNKTSYYTISVRLSSTLEPQTAIYEDIILKVTDSPRELSLVSNQNIYKVNEGKELSFTLDITSEDFPQGPFAIQGVGIPPGMTLRNDPQNPASFLVEYEPNYNTVSLNEQNTSCITSGAKSCSRKFTPITFIATGPDGRSVQLDNVTIEVIDVRIPALFGIAPNVQVEPPGSIFTITSLDQNLEVQPRLRLLTYPDFGSVKAEAIEDEYARYTSVLQVQWTDIPPEKAGAIGSFLFQSCIRTDTKLINRCTVRPLNVEVTGIPHRRPEVRRTDWERGEVKRLFFGQSERYPVHFRDTDGSFIKDITIYPESMRDMVRFDPNATLMSIEADREGIHHIQLETEGEFGVGAIENFTFEVFPQSRSNTLYFGDSPLDRSLEHYKSLTDIDYFSPIVHTDTEREFLYRSRMVVSTESLAVEGLIDQGFLEHENIETLFIASPMIDQLPEGFRATIEELGIFFDGHLGDRISTDEGQEPSTDWEIVVVDNDSGMIRPKGRVGFFPGHNPALLSLSLTSALCKPLLVIQNGRRQYYTSVECPLPEDKRVILSGFEWSALSTTSDDAQLTRSWYETLMSNRER